MSQLACGCSVALHAGLLAWAVWPSHMSDVPQQQIVDVMVVTPSDMGERTEQAEVAPEQAMQPEPAPVAKTGIVQKRTQPKQLQSAATPPTTGLQAPDAVQHVAALTEPMFDAAYLHNTPPAYPDRARRDGIEGKVLLDVAVSPEGKARAVFVRHSSGSTSLDEAAHKAVSSWRFVPARHGAESVEAKVIVPVEFRLE